MTKETLSKNLALLCEQYDRQPTSTLLELWWLVLKDMDDDLFSQAVANILKSRIFASMPKPGEVMESVNGKPEDVAIIALDKLERAFRKHGRMVSIVFDDPIIHAVVTSMGGWVKLCGLEWDEWKFRRIEFQKTYQAFSGKERQITIPQRLVGIEESDNQAYQRKFEVGYVGDRKKIDEWTAKAIECKASALPDAVQGMVKGIVG